MSTRLLFFCAKVENVYLLYLDDSGSAKNPTEDYLVLGGICLLENQVDHFTQELDQIARRLNPNDPDPVEFHASDIWSGREPPWSQLKDREQRKEETGHPRGPRRHGAIVRLGASVCLRHSQRVLSEP
ncbi:MAG: DUF3800 domain-containing protein [Planctomycetia bacterium]|nr:DUF3800 domain-containing protein [Planctomycetia bacterium]